MKALMFIVGGVLMIGTIATVGGFNAGGSFDYETATIEERQAFLDEHAKRYEKTARFFLKSGGGPMSVNLSLDEAIGHAKSREIELKVKATIPYGQQAYIGDLDQEVVALCKRYHKALYQNDIKVVVNIKDQKGMPLTSVTAAPAKCDRVLQRTT